ncbi:MAG: geranylgeranylglyceryl/heptaprenylglyceryl phosphate synthase [candidate division Zixibacteria bacterium]|nr:geranylgeranylglyceryl/heptaprenylglyceryl phosphate synthase [candidate division Zixibacteria bacterium]
MTLFEKLLAVKQDRGAGFFLLLDPDQGDVGHMIALAESAADCGVDAILAGSSLVTCADFHDRLAHIKRATTLPVILFPGNSTQISPHADGILYLSLISGRNPQYLIEEQVRGAPLVKEYGLEPIPTGYMLIESGRPTSVQYVSGTMPIPRDKTDIARIHALAAGYMGMKVAYLEAGSGAAEPVPVEMIAAVADYGGLPVIVGGGIKSPHQAEQRVAAGASFVVVGNRFEGKPDLMLITEMADAIHTMVKTSI